MDKKTIYRYINILANKQRRRFEKMELDLPLSSSQAKIMHFILSHDEEEVLQKDVEEEFSMRAPSATELLKAMEAKGLLRRKPSESDARCKRIVVSESAREYKPLLDQELNSIESQITEGITDEELKIWKDITDRMINNL